MEKLDQWFLARWGKFTASEVFKLVTKPKSTNEFWSEVAKTYIEERAIQSVSAMWERPELEEVPSLLWGKVHEYPAYEMYIKTTKNYSMTYLGREEPIFLEYELLKEESGGTPDVANITVSNEIDMGCEIKCSKNPSYHFRRLNWKDQFDLKENYSLVYAQIQHLMMITGATEWHFVSFDDRQLYTSKKIKIIPVYTDQKFQDNLEIRIKQAIKEKYKLLSNYFETEVKCKGDFIKLVNAA